MGDAGEKGLRGRAAIAARSSLRFRTRGPARPLSGSGRSLGGARPLGRVTVGGAQGACQVRQPVARPAPWKGDCIGPRDARRRAAARACRALGGHFSSVSIHMSTGPVVHARMQHTVPPTLTRSSATRRRWVGEPLAPAFSRRGMGSGPGVVVPYRSFRFAKAMVGGYPFVPACTHAAVSARNTPVFYWLLIFCGACPLCAAGEVQVAHKIRAHKVTRTRRPLTWQREVRRQPIRVRPSDPEPHPCCDDL